MAKPGITLEGDTALVSALAELGRSMGGQALDASMRKGARILTREAEKRWQGAKNVNQTAAQSSGPGVAFVKQKGQPRHSPVFQIGMTGDAMKTAHWVEFGTQVHSVKPGASIRRGIHVGEKPLHPGNPAVPFFRQAYEAKGDEARTVIMTDLARQIEKKAAQLYAKTRR